MIIIIAIGIGIISFNSYSSRWKLVFYKTFSSISVNSHCHVVPSFSYFQILFLYWLFLCYPLSSSSPSSLGITVKGFFLDCDFLFSHPYFLLYMRKAIGSWPVICQKTSFEAISGHLIPTIRLRQWLTKQIAIS